MDNEDKWPINQVLVLQDGRLAHYAGHFCFGHEVFKDQKSSLSVEQPYHLCDNLERIDIDLVKAINSPKEIEIYSDSLKRRGKNDHTPHKARDRREVLREELR